EVAVGIDDHDVILAGEGVLVRLQATVKAVEFLVSTVGVRVDPGSVTVTLTAGLLSFGKGRCQDDGLLTVRIGTDTFSHLLAPGTESLGQLLALGRHPAIHVLADGPRQFDGLDPATPDFDPEFCDGRFVGTVPQGVHQLITLSGYHL